ncbi:MAG: hypothetical protein ACRDBR_00775 [Metamycoplasmataceae bacterium]
MHNTQFPYFADRKQINTDYNQNQQFFARTNNGWIIQGNTQVPEEAQTLTLSITKVPLTNKQTSNIYYNNIPQQAPIAPINPPTSNIYYNNVPQQQYYPQQVPVASNPPVFSNYPQTHHYSTNSNNIPQHNQTPNINYHNNTLKNNRPPTIEELLPLIYDVMDIARTQKTLLYTIINNFAKHEGK